ncbi:MAG: hypothetical protein ACO3A2_03795 [Bdellovibrionia bacterium]
MLSLIPLFPFIGFLINGSWYAFGQSQVGQKKSGSLIPGVIATVAILASFVISVTLFLELQGLDSEHRILEQVLFPWITVGSLNLNFVLRVDSLSTLFTLVITGVGTLIHLYSIGYMSHD